MSSQCPTSQLQQYVHNRLDDAFHAGLIEHLDQCESCRRMLDESTASQHDWQLAAEALKDACGVDAQDVFRSTSSATDSVGSWTDADPVALLQVLAPCDDPRAAGRIGPFEVVGFVGSGGMGIVVKARDPALDRYVAIKMLAPHLASSKSARLRFAREARTAAAVIHENVIEIYQVAHWRDLPYLVMPYLPDPPLSERLERHGKLELESILSIGLQIARGLSAAHAQGLVHRDVKPANVLLCKGTERAVITDFGLARATDDASLTRAGTLAGTPHYMSPEQARGQAVDQRSDLFSLGSLLFVMSHGQPPVNRELGSDVMARIADGKLPSLREVEPSTPDWFVRLVDWLHAKDPARRPVSAELVAELLEQCLAHLRQPHKTALPKALQRRSPSRMRVWAVGAVGMMAVLTISLASALIPGLKRFSMDAKEFESAGVERPTPFDLLESSRPEQDAPEPAWFPPNHHPNDESLLDWSNVEMQLESLKADATELETSVDEFWDK